MNDIALAAGVTKPVLYQHFESKHHLFLELLTDTSSRLIGRIEESIIASSTGREKVESAFAAYVDFFATDLDNFHIIYGEGVRSEPMFTGDLRAIQKSFVDFTAEHIDIEGLDHEARLVAAQSIAGFLESGVRHWLDSGRSMDSGALADLLSSLAWRGLRGTQRS